jgi:Leucine-rich repeat (LRR) protein
LDAGYNTITNLATAPELPHLKKLNLAHNNISDISSLALHQIDLEELDLSYNTLSEIKPLENLKKLKKLNLTEIKPLENLKKLKKLNLMDCHIENNNIDFGKLTDLESLLINNISEDHISGILKLKKLKYLKCENLNEEGISRLRKYFPKLFIDERYNNMPMSADTTAFQY